VRTVDFDFCFEKQTLHAQRSARHKAAGIVEHELCDVSGETRPRPCAVERAAPIAASSMCSGAAMNQDTVNVGIAIELSTRPRSSVCVIEAGSSNFIECRPSSRHILSSNGHRRAKLEIVSNENDRRPGVTPFALSSAMSAEDRRHFLSNARPSISFAMCGA